MTYHNMKFHDIWHKIPWHIYDIYRHIPTRYHVDVTAVLITIAVQYMVVRCSSGREWESAESLSLTDSLHIYTWLLQAPPTLVKCSSYCILDAHLCSTRLLCLQMHAHIDVLVIITNGFAHFKFQLWSPYFPTVTCTAQAGRSLWEVWQKITFLSEHVPISSARQRNLTFVLFLSQGLCKTEAVNTVVSSVKLLRAISISGCDHCVRLGSLVPKLPPWHKLSGKPEKLHHCPTLGPETTMVISGNLPPDVGCVHGVKKRVKEKAFWRTSIQETSLHFSLSKGIV